MKSSECSRSLSHTSMWSVVLSPLYILRSNFCFQCGLRERVTTCCEERYRTKQEETYLPSVTFFTLFFLKFLFLVYYIDVIRYLPCFFSSVDQVWTCNMGHWNLLDGAWSIVSHTSNHTHHYHPWEANHFPSKGGWSGHCSIPEWTVVLHLAGQAVCTELQYNIAFDLTYTITSSTCAVIERKIRMKPSDFSRALGSFKPMSTIWSLHSWGQKEICIVSQRPWAKLVRKCHSLSTSIALQWDSPTSHVVI